MAHYIFKIEAESFSEMLEKIKLELNILNEQEEEIRIKEECLRKKVSIAYRSNKKWTEFEIDFIKQNYMGKTNEWIAKKLGRKKTSISTALNKMYKSGLKRRSNRTINIQ